MPPRRVRCCGLWLKRNPHDGSAQRSGVDRICQAAGRTRCAATIPPRISHSALAGTELSQVYLIGNSLGLQPKRTAKFVQQELDKWRNLAAEAHFSGSHPWMPYHEFLSAPMAQLVGGLAPRGRRHEFVDRQSALDAGDLLPTHVGPASDHDRVRRVSVGPFCRGIPHSVSRIRSTGIDAAGRTRARGGLRIHASRSAN